MNPSQIMEMHVTSRRRFVAQMVTVFGASILPWQQLLAAPILTGKRIRELRGGVYQSLGSGGTMGLFMDRDAMVVVDTQNHRSAADIVAKVKELTDKKIDYVINTHHHRDHIGGNNVLREISKELVAHEACARFQSSRKNHWQPTIQFRDSWRQRVGSEVVSLYHYGPGHTGGDSIVHFENANVVHAGDLIWNLSGPRVDHGGGCNMMQWIEVLEKMDQKFDSDTIYMFGHGKSISGKNVLLRDFRKYMMNTIRLVHKRHRAGDNLETILKIKKVPGSEAWPYSARTLKGAYAEVTGKVKRVAYSPLESVCCGPENS